MKTKFSSYFPVVAGIVLVFAVAVTVISLQQQQNTSSRAAEEMITALAPGTACSNGPADIMLIIDKSGSMTGSRLSSAKTAAKRFVDIVARNSNNRVGLVSFSTTATRNNILTNEYALIKSKIDAIKAGGHTCTQCGVKKSNDEIIARSREKDANNLPVKKVVVLLTDGKANWLPGWTDEKDGKAAEDPVIALVNSIKASHQAVFYTIGLGASSEINSDFLTQIASITGGHYYRSPTASDLNKIYAQISATIGTGSIAGLVFNDANGNAALDTEEQKLPDWTIQLFAGTSTTPQATKVSGSQGDYKFEGLCDGSYTVKEVLKPGWTQTLPKNPDYYPVTITNSSQIIDKNFGNMSDQGVKLSLDILMHGIGKAGDSPNPGPAGGGNPDPIHKSREVTVDLTNSQNQTITKKGTVTYVSGPGNFTGDVDMGTLPSGNYLVKVKLSQSLRKQIGGIHNLVTGTTSAMPQVSLVTGDINNDNKVSLDGNLDIRDYNILLGCFSTYLPPKSCNPGQKLQSDLDDNGKVDQFDFNLFVREISHISN